VEALTLAEVAARIRADYEHTKGPNRVRADGICVDEDCFCGQEEYVLKLLEAVPDWTLRDRVEALAKEFSDHQTRIWEEVGGTESDSEFVARRLREVLK